MALTAQQLKANEDYKAGKIDAATYKKLYITPSKTGATSTAKATSAPSTTTTTSKTKVGDQTLSEADLARVKALGDAWTAANKIGDKTAMDAAHTAAEDIRAAAGYSGGLDGSGYNKIEAPKAVAPVVPKAAPTLSLPKATDNSRNIQNVFDSMAAAQTASLNAARDQANSDYNAQIQGAPAQFQPGRDQVDIGAARNLQARNETAAAKGNAFSGGVASDQGAIVANADTQKTALTQQEINLVQNLKKAISDNNRATSFKEIELNATTNAQKNSALIDESNRLYNTQYQQAMDQANYGVNVAGITGYFNGDRTLQGQQIDTSNQQWSDSFQYQKDRDVVGDNQWQQSFDQSTEQWQQTFDYQKNRDKVADGQWLKSFQASQDNAAASRAISWGNLALDREKFSWSKDPSNPNNVMQAVEGESDMFKSMFDRSWDMIGSTKKTVDPNTGQIIDAPKYTQKDVGVMIRQSALSDDEAYRLMKMLNVPIQ